MTKTISKISLCLFAVAALCLQSLHGQTTTTSTTLSAALDSRNTVISLASGTGVSAAGLGPVTGLYVDREYMTVLSAVGSSTTLWNVKRGVNGITSAHVSGKTVWVGPPSVFDLGPKDRVGACTASTFQYLPIIQVQTGTLMNCDGNGQYSPLGMGEFYVPPTQCTFVPTTLTQTSTYTFAGASSVFVLKGISNAAAGTMTLTCNIMVPTNVAALRGAIVTDITLFLASSATGSGVVPTSVGTSTLGAITFSTAAATQTSSTVTPVATGSTVTTLGASAASFLAAVTTDGSFYSIKHTYAAVVDLSTDLKMLVYQFPILQSAASVSTLFTPGLVVHYRAAI